MRAIRRPGGESIAHERQALASRGILWSLVVLELKARMVGEMKEKSGECIGWPGLVGTFPIGPECPLRVGPLPIRVGLGAETLSRTDLAAT